MICPDEIRQAPPREPIHLRAKTYASQTLVDLKHQTRPRLAQRQPSKSNNNFGLILKWSNLIKAQLEVQE